jgi:hypothetical protein
MKLTKLASMIKAELEMDLQKRGSSVPELESALQSLNTGEGVYKLANDNGGILSDFVMRPGLNAVSGLPGLALNASAAGGAVGGLTFDELEKNVGDLNQALEREREKVRMVRRLTDNLKREHNL